MQASSRVTAFEDPQTASSAALATTVPRVTATGSEEAVKGCREPMVLITGGDFETGSPHGPADERPRFFTRVADYCLDRTEVTVSAYASCVGGGACSASPGRQLTCNAGQKGREKHPMNCVSWDQASTYCAWRDARLPSELEWEYAARGGAKQLEYSWGNSPPSDQLCWKRSRSCEVASFEVGAFGLFDMIGNVWEWTASWYGSYPWPPLAGQHRIYRGGSWSRRFAKWLSPTLRNRYGSDHWGSHLGFRCARRATGAPCPFGEDEQGLCLHGVTRLACSAGQSFNGARCAKPGEPLCEQDARQVPGHGCVRSGRRPTGGGARAQEPVVATAVRAVRSPEFDADCQEFQPARPKAYRFEQGTHTARNQAGAERGCKNRDVGEGWNSACCSK